MYLGIDVVIMSTVAILMIVASMVATKNTEQDKASLAVLFTAITAVTMVICYVVMARGLDSVLGAYGW